MQCKTLRRFALAAALGIAVAFAGCGSRVPADEKAGTAAAANSGRSININTATEGELTTLPGIGDGLAKRIIEYRNEHGAFRKTEHIMMVEGISDTRFRKIKDLITTH